MNPAQEYPLRRRERGFVGRQPLLVQHQALQQVLAQAPGGPLAELLSLTLWDPEDPRPPTAAAARARARGTGPPRRP
jgi:hypothetical protein